MQDRNNNGKLQFLNFCFFWSGVICDPGFANQMDMNGTKSSIDGKGFQKKKSLDS